MDAHTVSGTDAVVEQRRDQLDAAYARAKQIVGKDRGRAIGMRLLDAYTVLARAAVTAALTLVTVMVFFSALHWPDVLNRDVPVDSHLFWSIFFVLFAIYVAFDAGHFTRSYDAKVSKYASEIFERERIRAEIDQRVEQAFERHASLVANGVGGD